MEDDNAVLPVAGAEENATAPLEDVTSSEQVSDVGDEGGKGPDQVKPQSEIDPLTVLETLQLDQATKEALKSGYMRNKDYTQKTQDLAQYKGFIEEYQKVRPVIEYLDKNPDVFNELFKKVNGQDTTPAKPSGDEPPNDPKEYADWLQSRIFQQLEQQKAKETDYAAAAKVDARLDSDPEFGDMVARMVANDPDFMYGKINASQATKKAVENIDRYIAKQVSSAKIKLSEKAKLKAGQSSARSLPGSTTKTGSPTTIAEAAAMAEQELNN